MALQAQPVGHHQNWQLPDTRKNVHKVALTAAYGDQLLPLGSSNQRGHRECSVLEKEIKARCPMVFRRPLGEQQCCPCPGAGGPSRLHHSPLNCTPAGGAVSSMTDKHSTNPNTTLKI